jgi:hypothetical protein
MMQTIGSYGDRSLWTDGMETSKKDSELKLSLFLLSLGCSVSYGLSRSFVLFEFRLTELGLSTVEL